MQSVEANTEPRGSVRCLILSCHLLSSLALTAVVIASLLPVRKLVPQPAGVAQASTQSCRECMNRSSQARAPRSAAAHGVWSSPPPMSSSPPAVPKRSNLHDLSPHEVCLVNGHGIPPGSIAAKLYSGHTKAMRDNKLQYCRACGYRCLLSNRTSDFPWDARAHLRPGQWWKIPLMMEALNAGCKLAVWMDADVIVLQPFAIETLVRRPVVVARDKYGANTGVLMLLRADVARSTWATELLGRVWRRTEFMNHEAAEQAGLRKELLELQFRNQSQQVQMASGLVVYSGEGGHGGISRAISIAEAAKPQDRPKLFHAAGCFSMKGQDARCVRCGYCRQKMRELYRPAAAALRTGQCLPLDEPFALVSNADVRPYVGDSVVIDKKWRPPSTNASW